MSTTSRFSVSRLLSGSARAARAGDMEVARLLLEQAMAHPEAVRHAGRIERARHHLIRKGGYDAPPWQPHPDFCVACFLSICSGDH